MILKAKIFLLVIYFHLAVPATPTSTVCAVYDMATEALQIIQSTWNEVVCCV